ncbi:MAG TPA: hypothetical protein VHE30_20770 [Polyangiaceae bacterium]|nr:hypothetical protein [Polyangiaceae bacterium]
MDEPDRAGTAAPPSPTTSGDPGKSWALEIALAAVLVFLPSILDGYVYDDVLLIRDNRYAHGLDQLGRAFTTFFWQLARTGSGGLHYYRPLITTSYILDWFVSGGKPWFFHFANVVAHGSATYLFVKLGERWTGSRLLAFAAGVLFALHPSRTESVEWIAGRTDVYMTVLLFAAIELAWRASERPSGGARALLSPLCFVLAILCKEAAVMLPVLLGVDVLLASGDRKRALLRNLYVSTGLAAVYTALRVFVFPVRLQKLEFTPAYGLMTVAAYVERTVLPWPQTFFHRPLVFENGTYVYPSALVFGGALVVLAYGALSVRALLRDRPAGVLLLGAAIAFGPLLNFTYTGIFVTTSDHFLYLPLGLFTLGVGRYQGVRAVRALSDRRVRLGLVGLASVYLGVDVLRCLDFRDQESMFRAELRAHPDNPIVLKSLGEERARNGDIDEAFSLLLRSTLPGSTRYRLLMPEWLATQTYFRLVALQASRTADGNVGDLQLLYRELYSLATSGPPVQGKVGELTLGRRLPPRDQALALEQGGREILASEAAFVATRLGDDAHAKELLSTLGPDAIEYVPVAQNLCLAHARLQDFDGARRWLRILEGRLGSQFPPHSLDPLRKRLDTAESDFAHAASASSRAERRIFRARGFAELGAHLRALRELRPVIESGANVGPVGPVYVNLLVAAGLDGEALELAVSALGPDEGQALVQRARSSLSPHLRKLRKPEGPSEWKTLGKAPGGAP